MSHKRRQRTDKNSRDNDFPMLLAWLAVVTSMAVFGIWFGVTIWEECREAGHSMMYCMRMVIR